MIYTVQATITRITKRINVVSAQVPTFLLSSQIQGIVDVKHAADIAYDMIATINPDCGICVTVCDQAGCTSTRHAANGE